MGSTASSYEPASAMETPSFVVESPVAAAPEPVVSSASSYTPYEPAPSAGSQDMPWDTSSWVGDSGNAVKKPMHKKPLMGSTASSYEPASVVETPVTAAPEPMASSASAIESSSYTPAEPFASLEDKLMPWNSAPWVRDSGNAVKKSAHKKPLAGSSAPPVQASPSSEVDVEVDPVSVERSTFAFDPLPVSSQAMPWNTASWVRDSGNAVKKSKHKKPLAASSVTGYQPASKADKTSWAPRSSGWIRNVIRGVKKSIGKITEVGNTASVEKEEATKAEVESKSVDATTKPMPSDADTKNKSKNDNSKKLTDKKPLAAALSSLPFRKLVGAKPIAAIFPSADQERASEEADVMAVVSEMPWNTASWVRNEKNKVKKSIHKKPMPRKEVASASEEVASIPEEVASIPEEVASIPEEVASIPEEVALVPEIKPIEQETPKRTDAPKRTWTPASFAKASRPMPWDTAVWVADKKNKVKKSLHKRPPKKAPLKSILSVSKFSAFVLKTRIALVTASNSANSTIGRAVKPMRANLERVNKWMKTLQVAVRNYGKKLPNMEPKAQASPSPTTESTTTSESIAIAKPIVEKTVVRTPSFAEMLNTNKYDFARITNKGFVATSALFFIALGLAFGRTTGFFPELPIPEAVFSLPPAPPSPKDIQSWFSGLSALKMLGQGSLTMEFAMEFTDTAF